MAPDTKLLAPAAGVEGALPGTEQPAQGECDDALVAITPFTLCFKSNGGWQQLHMQRVYAVLRMLPDCLTEWCFMGLHGASVPERCNSCRMQQCQACCEGTCATPEHLAFCHHTQHQWQWAILH